MMKEKNLQYAVEVSWLVLRLVTLVWTGVLAESCVAVVSVIVETCGTE